MEIRSGHEWNADVSKRMFADHLGELSSMECEGFQLLTALEAAAVSPWLRRTIRTHRFQTLEQRGRVLDVRQALDFEDSSAEGSAFPALADSIRRLLAQSDSARRDVVVTVALLRLEHYEIAAYMGAVRFARVLERPDLAEVLQVSLDEEADMERILSWHESERPGPSLGRLTLW